MFILLVLLLQRTKPRPKKSSAFHPLLFPKDQLLLLLYTSIFKETLGSEVSKLTVFSILLSQWITIIIALCRGLATQGRQMSSISHFWPRSPFETLLDPRLKATLMLTTSPSCYWALFNRAAMITVYHFIDLKYLVTFNQD